MHDSLTRCAQGATMTLTSAISRTFLGSILVIALAASAAPAYAQHTALGVDLAAAPESADVIEPVAPSDVEIVNPACFDSVSCDDQSVTLNWDQQSPDKTISWEI